MISGQKAVLLFIFTLTSLLFISQKTSRADEWSEGISRSNSITFEENLPPPPPVDYSFALSRGIISLGSYEPSNAFSIAFMAGMSNFYSFLNRYANRPRETRPYVLYSAFSQLLVQKKLINIISNEIDLSAQHYSVRADQIEGGALSYLSLNLLFASLPASKTTNSRVSFINWLNKAIISPLHEASLRFEQLRPEIHQILDNEQSQGAQDLFWYAILNAVDVLTAPRSWSTLTDDIQALMKTKAMGPQDKISDAELLNAIYEEVEYFQISLNSFYQSMIHNVHDRSEPHLRQLHNQEQQAQARLEKFKALARLQSCQDQL